MVEIDFNFMSQLMKEENPIEVQIWRSDIVVNCNNGEEHWWSCSQWSADKNKMCEVIKVNNDNKLMWSEKSIWETWSQKKVGYMKATHKIVQKEVEAHMHKNKKGRQIIV